MESLIAHEWDQQAAFQQWKTLRNTLELPKSWVWLASAWHEYSLNDASHALRRCSGVVLHSTRQQGFRKQHLTASCQLFGQQHQAKEPNGQPKATKDL